MLMRRTSCMQSLGIGDSFVSSLKLICTGEAKCELLSVILNLA